MTVIVKYEGGPLNEGIRVYSQVYPKLTAQGASESLIDLLKRPNPRGCYQPKDRKRKGLGTLENPLIYVWVPDGKVPAVSQQTV